MARIVGLSQYSRRAANRQQRHSITDRKPTRSSLQSKQPLMGGLAKKS